MEKQGMRDSYSNPPDICKRCGSSNLFLRSEGQHIALRCTDCGGWQRWVSRRHACVLGWSGADSTPYRQTPEQVRPSFDPASSLLNHENLTAKDCCREVLELKR